MSNQVKTYNPFQVYPVSSPELMKYSESISDLSKIDINKTKLELTKIMVMYLSTTSKVKNLSEIWYQLINEHLIENCNNLELQEIEFIFKNGIMGRLGCNYQEISIDTITGVDGWIENYYRNFRNKRPEPIQKSQEFQLTTGNEITHDEFLSKNPEYASKSLDAEIKPKVQEWTIGLLKEKLGDSFSELFESASKEFDNMIDKLNQLEDIIKKNRNKVESAMYDAFLVQKKAGKQEFIINRLRRKVR